MLVPLYGFVAGDTLGVLVLVQDHDTIGQVTRTLAQAVAMRMAPRPHARLRARGELLDPRATVAASGLVALDRIDLIAEATP